MSRLLHGKTALITGASKRIGKATALALAREGVNIVIHYNTSDTEANELKVELDALGVSSWTIGADFTVTSEYESLVERSLGLCSKLDILINNASIFPMEDMNQVTFSSMTESMLVNAWVPFYLSREFATRVGKGQIINLIDSRVTGYDWMHVGYIWSKHVLAAMTDMTALGYAPDITVNGVDPGLILPPPGKDESYLERLKDTVPLKMHGNANDIAEAIVYLLKTEFVTGNVIYVDGGRHLKEYKNG